MKHIYCEITDEMDKHFDPRQVGERSKSYFRTYVYSDKDDKPVRGTYIEDDDEYFWYLRVPGYTCANVAFNSKDDTVNRIVLTRRGGAFANADLETVYVNPDKLEKALNKQFVGKKITWRLEDD